MKKGVISFLLFFLLLFLPIITFAEEYECNTLIPVDTVATVRTEKFIYQDFVYNSYVDSNGNSVLTFNAITNNTISKVPISINVLLFSEDKKNIGFLSYCTDKDINSDYNGYKLSGNQSSPFVITVSSKYFGENFYPNQVRYIAVMDENKYCRIGGSSNYIGLTMDEILHNSTMTPPTKGDLLDKYLTIIKNSGFVPYIVGGIILLFACNIIGKILNRLHKRIFGKKTALAYFPILNAYIAARLTFGSIIAVIYLIIYIASFWLLLIGNTLFAIITNIIFVFCILMVLFKLVTRKYNWLLFEPSFRGTKEESLLKEEISSVKNKNEKEKGEIEVESFPISKESSISQGVEEEKVNEKKSFVGKIGSFAESIGSKIHKNKYDDDYVPPSSDYVSPIRKEDKNMSLIEDGNQTFVDLSYDSVSDEDSVSHSDSDEYAPVSSGDVTSSLNEGSKGMNTEDLYNLSDDDDDDEFDDDGESDLTNFYQ